MRVTPSIITVALLLAAAPAPARTPERVRVASITFTGNNEFAARVLKRVLLTREKGLLEPGIYSPQVLAEDLLQLERYYRLNGYLGARVAGHTVQADTARNRVAISIRLEEGEPTLVEGISVLGNRVLPDSLLMTVIKLKTGERLRQELLDKAVNGLLTLYSDRGYLDVKVNPAVTLNPGIHRALVDFTVEEGAQYRVGPITVRGLVKTKEYVVRRELKFSPGEVISYSRLLAAQRSLYLTGLFRSVRVLPVPSDSGTGVKDVHIEVKENDSGEYGLGIGYGTHERLRLTGDIQNRNLGGTGRRAGLRGKVSMAGAEAGATFTEPFTFGTRWETDVTADGTYGIEPGYELVRYGARLETGRQLLQYGRMALRYRAEQSVYTNIIVSGNGTLPGQAGLQSLTLRLIRDTRDNLFNPDKGTLLEWENEAGRSVYEGAGLLLRSQLTARAYLSLGRGLLVGAFSGGGIRATGTVPLDERFYAGGPQLLRGFPYRGVGPTDAAGVTTGGTSMALAGLELRYPVYRMIGIAVFIDAGGIGAGAALAVADGIRVSPGLGLRGDTALGVVRFDAGANPWPRPGEDRWQFHVSMGQAF